MRVTVTGAAGRIGRVVVPGLVAAGHDVRGVDVVRPDEPWAHLVTVSDARSAEVAAVIGDADAVVHLAANAGESDFETAVDSHLRLTERVLEAMRAGSARRLVYASSNHAVGFAPRNGLLTTDVAPQPDTYYGFGKAAAEALCRLHHERHGLAVACLRIGSFRDRPRTRRELSTWLSHGDAVRLVDACLRAPALAFAIVYGISANTRRWWDLRPGQALGYEPADDAECWAAEVEATAPTEADELDAQHVGGGFARRGQPTG